MLQDSLNRTFTYLRLSITEKCNFRCWYCLPNGYQKNPKQPPFLSLDEITRLVTAFSQFGVCKVRITGGEPTLRRDFLAVAARISSIPNIHKVLLSTNGYRLLQEAHQYQAAGIQGVNVSLDSLNEQKFHGLTGHNKLDVILAGIKKAIDVGLTPIKLNVVLMKGINDTEIPHFIAWIKDKPVSVRFIELMPTQLNQKAFNERHLNADFLKEHLVRTGWTLKPRVFDAGPAEEFIHPDFIGSIGIIAPYAKDFCTTCNRLRMTSFGELKLCLFGETRYSLRHLLQHDDQLSELQNTLEHLLLRKTDSHQLRAGNLGDVVHFAALGG